MAPHYDGEAASFARAFGECERALHQFDETKVNDDNVVRWVRTVRQTIKTGAGSYLDRIGALSYEEKTEFANAVDELASWFDRYFWTGEK